MKTSIATAVSGLFAVTVMLCIGAGAARADEPAAGHDAAKSTTQVAPLKKVKPAKHPQHPCGGGPTGFDQNFHTMIPCNKGRTKVVDPWTSK